MEPLCARNILECVIIYVLEYAWANDKANPDSLEYVEDFSQNYTRQILGELDIPEIKPFISELIQPDYER
jgi:hypothetical protein